MDNWIDFRLGESGVDKTRAHDLLIVFRTERSGHPVIPLVISGGFPEEQYIKENKDL